jgi:hypothetical protein
MLLISRASQQVQEEVKGAAQTLLLLPLCASAYPSSLHA